MTNQPDTIHDNKQGLGEASVARPLHTGGVLGEVLQRRETTQSKSTSDSDAARIFSTAPGPS